MVEILEAEGITDVRLERMTTGSVFGWEFLKCKRFWMWTLRDGSFRARTYDDSNSIYVVRTKQTQEEIKI